MELYIDIYIYNNIIIYNYNTVYKGIFIEITIDEWIIIQEYTKSN